MSRHSEQHWGEALRAVLRHRGEDVDKPVHHDHVYRMEYLDNSRMRREMGHL